MTTIYLVLAGQRYYPHASQDVQGCFDSKELAEALAAKVMPQGCQDWESPEWVEIVEIQDHTKRTRIYRRERDFNRNQWKEWEDIEQEPIA